MKILKFGAIYAQDDDVIVFSGFSVSFGPEGLLLTEKEAARQILAGIIERLNKELKTDDLRMLRTNFILHPKAPDEGGLQVSS